MSSQSTNATNKSPKIFPKLFCGSAAIAFKNYLKKNHYNYEINYITDRDDLLNFIETYIMEFKNPDIINKMLNKFLSDDNIDAVYIATPHNYHMEYAIKCIKAKKHILCEKPFSYNYKTSKEVLDLAKENNVFIMER